MDSLKPATDQIPRILVIDLWPRESECILCGEHLWCPCKGLPMYEGEVVADDWMGEWAGFDVCDACYEKHRPGSSLKPASEVKK